MPLLSNKKTTPTFASLEGEIRARVAVGDGESWVFIVPNRIAQRRMERDLLEAANGRALPQLNILTLADIAGALATTAFPNFRVIGDGESAVLIELSIRELLREHKLSFFERAGVLEDRSSTDEAEQAFPIPRGTFELVVNTIRQLKESGVAPADIERDLVISQAKGETTEVRRARDIFAIYTAYAGWLQRRSFMDTHGQMLLVNERYENAPSDGKGSPIQQDFKTAFPRASDVFISGFYYLEPPSIALIARFAAIKNLSVIIELEEGKKNPDLFEGLIDLEKRLLDSGFHSIHRAPQNGNPLGDHIGRNLFRLNSEPIEQKKTPVVFGDATIQYVTAKDPADEVEDIARRIKLLYHSDPEIREDLSRIVVATPSPESYTPLFEEIFRRHEIPFQNADRYHLDRSPLVMALLSLLDASRTGLRKRELVRMLASPYFDFERNGTIAIDRRNLLDVLSRQRESGDAVKIVKSLTARLDTIHSEGETADDSAGFARAEAEENRIRRAIRDIHRLRGLVEPLTRTLTSLEFCNTVRSLLSELHTPERILAFSPVTIAVGTLENDTRAYRAVVTLMEELESLFYLMGIADEKRKGAYFEQRLKAALIVTRYSPRQGNRAVQLTSLAQSISQPAKYLFLAGLTEGSFPAPYQPQVFLTSGLQKGERKQLMEDRVLFYQAITNFKQCLYLSFPKKSAGSAETNRSNFLDALDEVLSIEAAPKTEGIFSSHDLFRTIGTFQNSPDARASLLESLAVSYPDANWLQTLREHVPRASGAITVRLEQEDSVYRGVVDRELLLPEERAVLENNKSRVWSVTQLELYAVCPFRFFARDVLALREEQELEEGLDARDRGSALHEILRQFLISRRERKLPAIQDVSESELGTIYEEVRQLAEDHFKTFANDHPFWRLDSELLLSENKPGGSVLWKFIDRERELAPYELRPRFFEVSFGGAGRAPKTPIDPALSQDAPIDLGGLKLRGKIDRIDIPKETEHATYDGNAFAIIDYKSGKETPPWSEIDRGISLQLPLYLRVAEDLLRSHIPGLKGVAAIYHKLLGENSERKLGIALRPYAEKAFESFGKKAKGGLFESEDELVGFIEQAVAKARTYVEGVADGKFPLIEADLIKHCDHCPYGSVCRIHEAQEAGVLH